MSFSSEFNSLIQRCFRDVYEKEFKPIDKYHYPRSLKIKEKHEAIAKTMLSLAGEGSSKAGFDGKDYNMFWLDGQKFNQKNQFLGTSTTSGNVRVYMEGMTQKSDSLTNVIETTDALHEEVISIYDEKSNEYFSFAGKESLKDIFLLDRFGYLQFADDIKRNLQFINEFQTTVNESSEFESSDENKLSYYQAEMLEFLDKLSYNQVEMMVNDAYSIAYHKNKPVIVDEEGIVLSDYTTLAQQEKGARLQSILRETSSIRQYVQEVDKEIKKLNGTFEMMEDLQEDLEHFNRELEDINSDLKKRIEGLHRIAYEGREAYVKELVDVTKKSYLVSGEANLDVLSETSVFREDQEFAIGAQEQAIVDELYDIGLIDESVVRRTDLKLDKLYLYIDIEKVDSDKLASRIEMRIGDNEKLDVTSMAIDYYLSAYFNEFYQSLSTEHPMVIDQEKVKELREMQIAIAILKDIRNPDEIYGIEMHEWGLIVHRREESYMEYPDEYKAGEAKVEIMNEIPHVFIYGTSGLAGYMDAVDVYFEQAEQDLREKLDAVLKQLNEVGGDVISDEVRNRLLEIGLEKGIEALLKYPGIGSIPTAILMTLSAIDEENKRLKEAKKSYETEISNLKGYEDMLTDYGVHAKSDDFLFSIGGAITKENGVMSATAPIIFENEITIQITAAVQDAAIIAQGPGTAGFDEALDSAWETAQSNGAETTNLGVWKADYVDNIQKNASAYQTMSEMSTQEIAENYDGYEIPLAAIEGNLHIITPLK